MERVRLTTPEATAPAEPANNGVSADDGWLVAGEFRVSLSEAQAFFRRQPLGLTRKELKLLSALIARPNRVLSRDAIHEQVWGGPLAHRRDRSVDVVVGHVRAKLAHLDGERQYIFSHHGLGYRLDPGGQER